MTTSGIHRLPFEGQHLVNLLLLPPTLIIHCQAIHFQSTKLIFLYVCCFPPEISDCRLEIFTLYEEIFFYSMINLHSKVLNWTDFCCFKVWIALIIHLQGLIFICPSFR